MRESIKGLTLLITIFFGLGEVVAQDTAVSPHVLSGADYTILLVQDMFSAEGGNAMERMLRPGEEWVVFRADGQSTAFNKVGSATFPSSPGDMEKRLSEGLLTDLLAQLNVRDAKTAYQLLQQHAVDTLGPLLFSPDVLGAFGIAFFDRSRKPDIASRYRIDHVDANGTTLRSVNTQVAAGLPDYTGRYTVHQYLVSDSAASVSWYSTAPIADDLPVLANIYRRMNPSGTFDLIKRVFVTGSEASDSSWVFFNETLPPTKQVAYYMQLVDFAGNKGPASDTLYAVAYDISQISGIASLQVTDTTSGLLLTWDPLPRQAFYSAIQVLKSRTLGSDYVVVDTLSASETNYLDEAVIPASSYYYKVRPLLFNLAGLDEMNFAEANGHKSMPEGSPSPQAPRDVRAELTDQGVKISWQHGDELNLFGYYVLRGPSAANLEVVSQPIQDTVYVDSLFSPGFSGQLHYAIQVADLSQHVSDTSAVVSVAIIQPVVLSPPGGLQARRTLDGVMLQWENAMLRDDQVEGFVVYRQQEGIDTYQLLMATPLRLPFFTDSTASGEASYTYAVTSIDAWGNQSILSPVSVVGPDSSTLLLPPAQLYLRNLSAGIEIAWPVPLVANGQVYQVFRKQVGQPDFVRLGTVDPKAVYLDKDVKADVLYEYAVGISVDQRGTPQSIRRL